MLTLTGSKRYTTDLAVYAKIFFCLKMNFLLNVNIVFACIADDDDDETMAESSS